MDNGKWIMEKNREKKRDIVERTFKFGVSIIRVANSLPKTTVGLIIARQIIRSGTSVGANVEEAQDGLTRKEFIKSMSVALKEARETGFWLRIAVNSNNLLLEKVEPIIKETEELIKILTTIVKKSKANS